jgi:serine/threonine protein kinase
MTGAVCSLWNRAPELLDQCDVMKYCAMKLDSWSVGCVLVALTWGEYYIRSNDMKKFLQNHLQYNRKEFFQTLASKNNNYIHVSTVIEGLLGYDASKRLSVMEASSFFPDSHSEPKRKFMLDFTETVSPTSNSRISASIRHIVSQWMWRTLIIGMNLSMCTFMEGFLTWEVYMTKRDKKFQPLCVAAACCSLYTKLFEVQIFSAHNWSKNLQGVKSKDIEEAECDVMKTLNGKLIHCSKYSKQLCALLTTHRRDVLTLDAAMSMETNCSIANLDKLTSEERSLWLQARSSWGD